MERISEHANANHIYDEFEPLSNWKNEQGFDTLTFYLPGFRKEQLKVQVTTTRKLRVMGDRQAGASKWIRFRKEFPIPPNIDVDSISAKFEGANLVVRLPRPEPIGQKTSPITTTAKPPLVPKENLKPPSSEAKEKVQPPKATREKEAELEKQAEKVQSPKPARENEEALKVAEKGKCCDGIFNQDYKSKVNAYKENLGGYMALMKNNKTAITAGVVVPAAAVLLLSLGFYAGQMFTSY